MITDRSKVSAIIIANPDLRVAPELLLWLIDSDIPRRNILIYRGNDRDQVAAYNRAVEMSLNLPNVEYHLFADSDIRPYSASNDLFDAPYDFTCLKCDTETGLGAWAEASSFHTGLWLARSSSLRQMAAPWFGWGYNPTHSAISKCVCDQFRKQAIDKGFRIGNVGHALHYPRGKQLPDSICVKERYTKSRRME
jgi:hypothetical protein